MKKRYIDAELLKKYLDHYSEALSHVPGFEFEIQTINLIKLAVDDFAVETITDEKSEKASA